MGSLVIFTVRLRALTKINIIRILHIIATSFVCREEIMRHKQVAKQKEIEQEDGVSTELETIAGGNLQAGTSNKLGGAKVVAESRI
jgi:hypothetical protein